MDLSLSPSASKVRLRLAIRGAVQGVGFRPFIYRLATALGLAGWVNNSPQGVFVEAEGSRDALESFLLRLEAEKPSLSSIQGLEPIWLDHTGYNGFEIRPSSNVGNPSALLLPDIATCSDCLGEIFDPHNRRYRYAFTNCTHCGPRFSLIEGLPYDRARTSMKRFHMCAACEAEYHDPSDRRFHAQPTACPQCGPRLALWDASGKPLPGEPLRSAVLAINDGRIAAVKGLGGFHLVVAANSDAGIARLRERKQREEKPFALMFPDLPWVKRICEVSPLEERLLRSPECPIVLLRHKVRLDLPLDLLAPGNPYLGVMLPYTPLHHLLLAELGRPIVATSGNLSDEPMCIDEEEALSRLSGIAEVFLVHDRPIVRHVDDSITRVMAGRELVLRRARGYAPLPVSLPNDETMDRTLAVGAHLKSAVALAIGSNAFISQHIGDLETEPANRAFRSVIGDFERMFDAVPETIVSDAHPGYLSTQYADSHAAGNNLRRVHVQHHLAHVFSCMAENQVGPAVLGVAWDGTGYGGDGTIWGGEFFRVTRESDSRFASFVSFPLPGGEAAVKEPKRTAIGLLYAAFGQDAFSLDLPPLRAFTPKDLKTLSTMLERGVNSPLTSSAGRLFDAVASLIGLRQESRFEGQPAMELEFTAERSAGSDAYPMRLAEGNPLRVEWHPALMAILNDLHAGVLLAEVARKFHFGMVEAMIMVAHRAGIERVALSGGCFQNRLLTERAIDRLRQESFQPYWHQRVPPNDGGISLGQVVYTRRAAKLRDKAASALLE